MQCPSNWSGGNSKIHNDLQDHEYSLEFKDYAELPEALKEISGICFDGEQLLSVNDEKGKLYHLEFPGYALLNKSKFYSKGDYEGMALDGDELYIIRSDRQVFKLQRGIDGTFALSSTNTIKGLPTGCETESIAFKDGFLFTICKEQWLRSNYQLYRFEPDMDNLSAEPDNDWSDILNTFMTSVKQKSFTVRPTDLYYDDNAGLWILLSTRPSGIFFIDKKGNLVYATLLDENDWPQPEAVTGIPGLYTYILSSEGKEKGRIAELKLSKD